MIGWRKGRAIVAALGCVMAVSVCFGASAAAKVKRPPFYPIDLQKVSAEGRAAVASHLDA
jgi:hypothetical protein